MGRIIGGVIAGYLVMFVVVFVLFTGSYMAMGADGAFRPGSYDVSTSWILLSIVVSLAAAVAGGWVCAKIARSSKGVSALAVVVLVLGVLSAIPILMAGDEAPKIRTADVPNMEAMMNAKQPLWIALLNPILGAAGVFAGGRLAG